MLQKIWIVLLLTGVFSAQAEVLIVTKEGKSFWVISANKKGEELSFQRDRANPKETMPMAEVYQIIPKVRRGQQYPPETVEKVLAAIKKAMYSKPKLRKQLASLQSEWKALQGDSAELEGEVDAEIAKYDDGDKATATFKSVIARLGMLRYKDLKGGTWEKIDTNVKRIEKDYFDSNFARLKGLTQVDTYSVKRFQKVSRFAAEMINANLPADYKSQIKELLAESRKKALDDQILEAELAACPATPTLAQYLAARTRLNEVRHRVAGKALLADWKKAETAIAEKAAVALGATHFFSYKGYPMPKRDVPALKRTGKLISSTAFPSGTVDDKCLLYPLAPVDSLTFGQPVALPLRIVFRRDPTEGASYALMSVVQSSAGATRRFRHPIEGLQIKGAQARVNFSFDPSLLPAVFAPAVDQESGKTALYVYLAEMAEEGTGSKAGFNGTGNNAGMPDSEWRILSLLCTIPLRVEQ